MDIHKIDKVEVLESLRKKVKADANRIPPDLKMAHLKARRGDLSMLAFVSIVNRYGKDQYQIAVTAV